MPVDDHDCQSLLRGPTIELPRRWRPHAVPHQYRALNAGITQYAIDRARTDPWNRKALVFHPGDVREDLLLLNAEACAFELSMPMPVFGGLILENQKVMRLLESP